MDAKYDEFIHGIAEGRCIDQDNAKAIVDNAPYADLKAIEAGVVDNLAGENALKLIKSVVFSCRFEYDCIVIFRPGPPMVDLN